MSFEVEVKYRSVDHDRLAERLDQLGAVRGTAVDQEDIYLSHPARDFALTREALRVRRVGEEIRITYKGPRLSGPTKTRAEIEIPLAPGLQQFERLLGLFEVLGFRSVATIRKHRQTFHFNFQGRELEIALDTAEGLGQFAEIEAITIQADLPAAQNAVLALATQLDLTEIEPRSYLRMFLENQTSGRR
jgi:adenylate cyclase class 2